MFYEGTSQYFNRKPFDSRRAQPIELRAGPSRRPHTNTEVNPQPACLPQIGASRNRHDTWLETGRVGVDALPDDLAAFYRELPHKLELDLYRQDTSEPMQKESSQKYGLRWELATACGNSDRRSCVLLRQMRPPEECRTSEACVQHR